MTATFPGLPFILIAGLLTFLGPALALVWLVRGQTRRHPTPLPVAFGAMDDDVVLLLDNDLLIDATEAGRKMLDPPQIGDSDRRRVELALAPTYPDVVDYLHSTEDFASVDLPAPRSREVLRLQRRNGILRLAVVRNLDDGSTIRVDAHRQREAEAELDTLRGIAE
jgi:hypothetical protein